MAEIMGTLSLTPDPTAPRSPCGVSSGIDVALRLAELLVDDIAARAVQPMIEYDPQPPFDCGVVAQADARVLERVRVYAATKD